jgi:hypothetical protein
MGGTRARTIREDVATALATATLDRRVGVNDRLLWIKTSRRPESAPERAFRLVTSAPGSRDPRVMTADLFRLELMVELYYANGPDTEDRIQDDFERVWWLLETLHTVNAEIQQSDPAPLGVEETTNNTIARISLIILYRLDDTLVN